MIFNLLTEYRPKKNKFETRVDVYDPGFNRFVDSASLVVVIGFVNRLQYLDLLNRSSDMDNFNGFAKIWCLFEEFNGNEAYKQVLIKYGLYKNGETINQFKCFAVFGLIKHQTLGK
jgi:hypothetical protein